MSAPAGDACGNSRSVTSNQDGVHPRLFDVVSRHRRHQDRTPIHPRDAAVVDQWLQFSSPFSATAFDAGCGTGESTLQLAQRRPDRAVLGVDQSAHRLSRIGRHAMRNALLIRADCSGVWRAMERRDVTVDELYLLYPNPWPKAHHLLRRWHAHPVFPALVKSARVIELRTNWLIYAEEFAAALGVFGIDVTVEPYLAQEPISPFERKYRDSHHPLWRLKSKEAALSRTGV